MANAALTAQLIPTCTFAPSRNCEQAGEWLREGVLVAVTVGGVDSSLEPPAFLSDSSQRPHPPRSLTVPPPS